MAVRQKGNEYKIQDDAWVLDFYWEHQKDTAEELVHAVLSNIKMWDQDLTKVAGLEKVVAADLSLIREKGVEKAFASVL